MLSVVFLVMLVTVLTLQSSWCGVDCCFSEPLLCMFLIICVVSLPELFLCSLYWAYSFVSALLGTLTFCQLTDLDTYGRVTRKPVFGASKNANSKPVSSVTETS